MAGSPAPSAGDSIGGMVLKLQIILMELTPKVLNRLITRFVWRCALVSVPPDVRLHVHFMRPFFRVAEGRLPLWSSWIGFN